MTTITARASTESFVQFLEFKRTFNRQFKVSIAAIQHVSRIVSGSGGTRMMQGLVADTGEPWSKDFNWVAPADDLNAAMHDTTLLGVVQVHSAVDDMLSELRADFDRWRQFSEQEPPVVGDDEDQVDPLESTHVTVLRGDAHAFDQLRPILRYFRLARNCIAHRSSVTSPALADWSVNAALAESLRTWPHRAGVVLSPLPAFKSNEVIRFLPRHAIFALEAIYRAAGLLNRQFVGALGLDGLTYLAARRALFSEAPLNGLIAYRSAESVVADALSNRYRQKMNRSEVIQILKRLGIWKDCLTAYDRMYRCHRTSKCGH